jgi:hypothetical protein
MVRSPHHAANYVRAFRSGLEGLQHTRFNPAPGKEANAAGDAIQASATIGIGRTHDEADVAAAIAKNRKNERVRNHVGSFPLEQQMGVKEEVLRTGQVADGSLNEVHSLLPGLTGPVSPQMDSRWQHPAARRPISLGSLNDAAINPHPMPTKVDTGMRDNTSTSTQPQTQTEEPKP